MGLDVHAVGVPDEAFVGVMLPGTLSGAESSFQGRAMDVLCRRLGFTLYVEHMDAGDVKKYAKWLVVELGRHRDCSHRKRDWDCERCSYAHLKRFFQIVAEHEGEIVCCW
jgi:hypothetical protein